MIKVIEDPKGFAERFSVFLKSAKYNFAIAIIANGNPNSYCCDVTSAPYAVSPCKVNNVNYIVFNPDVIELCELTQEEQDAIILHEIGHLINAGIERGTELEILCDQIAVEQNMSLYLLSALYKIQDKLSGIDLKDRIDTLVPKVNIYRPEWTCGRYNKDRRVAIYYNLIEGYSYFFENDSADVIGQILCTKRGCSFSVFDLVTATGINGNCMLSFVYLLMSKALLTTSPSTPKFIKKYRENLIGIRRKHVRNEEKALQEMSVVSTADAERRYMEHVGSVSSVMLELTYRCSEMCVHCYNAGASRNTGEENLRGKREELCLKDYKRIIDEFYDNGLFKVCLTGGDPFSKSIVWDIIDYLYEKEIAFDIFTNGISITDKVEKLASYYPRTLGISLYSDIPEIHDSITRIKGSHDRTKSFIEQCSNLAIPMILKCCIMRSNVKSYYTVKSVARKYGALPQFDLNITDSVEGDRCASTFLRLKHEELEIVLRDEDLVYYVNKGSTVNSVRDMNGTVCNAGIESMCITPEGNIQPCCAFPMKIGNVRDGNVNELITASSTLSWWRSKKLKDCEDCNKHEYCVFCQMCVGNNFISHGTPLKASENNCFIAKERYELYVKLQKGYDPLVGKTLEERLADLKIKIPNLMRLDSVNFREKTRINGVS